MAIPVKYSPLTAWHKHSMRSETKNLEGIEEEVPLFAPGIASQDQRRRRYSIVSLHLLLFSINIILMIWTGIRLVQNTDPQHSATALRDVIRYEPRRFTFLHPEYKYVGPPRPELEQAWDELSQYENIAVSPEEVGHVNFPEGETLTTLSGSGNAYVTVAAYHAVHCVGRVQRLLYRGQYYHNMTDLEYDLLNQHTEHCLDYLRQYVMCNADTTLITMHWLEKHKKPAARDLGEHQCVVWNDIDQWMAKHSFDPLENGILMHPKFGDPYDRDPTHDHHNVGIGAPA
ncbi:hypothetical protein QBC38DRAFT_482361 [Podospora fimiseda]|uniref:Tat pathway signal sequence n=1 Tax=Podospora fimiseda TaxID=252190 RepID=A0AAN7BLP6_9PEZI|nr:hypothetical protein QBC38DRAFT_482361 [Podospora fimiseda]